MFNVLSPSTTATGPIYLLTGLKVVNRLCSLQYTALKIELLTSSFRSHWGSFILLTSSFHGFRVFF